MTLLATIVLTESFFYRNMRAHIYISLFGIGEVATKKLQYRYADIENSPTFDFDKWAEQENRVIMLTTTTR